MQENTELRQSMMQVAGSAAFGGMLMVLLGFWFFRDLVGASDSVVYNLSITIFLWTMRAGGTAMLVIAALAYLGWRPILAIDGVIASLTGVIMLATALIWVVNRDLDGVLMLVFGGLFVRSGMQSWALFRSARPPELERSIAEAPAPVDEHIAGGTSAGEGLLAGLLASRKRADKQEERVVMPKHDEPAPEGFLADLGRSSEEEKR